MSPRLLAAALLTLGLAGTASAAQPKGSEPLSDAGRHTAVADLASPVPAAKSDAEAWSMTESWIILSTPVRRAKPYSTVSLVTFGDAAPAAKSFFQPVADGNGNTPYLVQGNSNAATSDHASFGDVFEHRPDGKLPSVQ